MNEVKVIAETADVIAVEKPAGLIVHSDGRTAEPSLAQWITENYSSLRDVGDSWISPQGEQVPLNGIVHRLDRMTSGVVLVAKNNAAYAFLKNEFKKKRVEKIYRAYVYGHLEGQGRIVAEIVRSSQPPKHWFAKPTAVEDKRAATTEWKVLETFRNPDISYLELKPITGRTHQIRVHLASIGHPVVNDPLYAGNFQRVENFPNPVLHSQAISVNLPDGTRRTFETK